MSLQCDNLSCELQDQWSSSLGMLGVFFFFYFLSHFATKFLCANRIAPDVVYNFCKFERRVVVVYVNMVM